MNIAAITFSFIGGLIALYGMIRYLYVIYKHGILWLTFCLVILPIGYVVFFIRHPYDSVKPVLIVAFGMAIMWVVYLIFPETMNI
jgi:hypothetical protein